jgi:hypothetical protein
MTWKHRNPVECRVYTADRVVACSFRVRYKKQSVWSAVSNIILLVRISVGGAGLANTHHWRFWKLEVLPELRQGQGVLKDCRRACQPCQEAPEQHRSLSESPRLCDACIRHRTHRCTARAFIGKSFP